MAHLDVSRTCAAGWGVTHALRPTVWQAAVVALALAAFASFFPLRFTATATLVFDVGTQPPSAAVRGVAQVLASREMAYDVIRRLGPEDAARIAGIGLVSRLGLGTAAADGRSEATRAAWRLMEDLEVAPVNGGRDLGLSLSAATPGLAARAADAYVSAFLALDAAARTSGEGGQLPPLRRGTPGAASLVPDLPRPLALVLLAASAVLLVVARRHAVRDPQEEGPLDHESLPVELQASHRIAWLGSAGAGLDEESAIDRLVAEAGPPGGACHLILLTSEELPDASARCAVALARRLSEDARVALVALDGAAESLAGLVSAPWAPGMSELLFGVAGFGETIHRDAKSRAHVIPPGRDALSGPSVVGAERLTLVLEALRQTYDYVVVASPDLGAAHGGRRLAALNPLVVWLSPDTAPPTAAVESFDALAERHFARVVMLSIASPHPQEDEAAIDSPTPVPTLDAEDEHRAHSPEPPVSLAGAA